MENQRGGGRPPRSLPREKVFGANALHLSDHEAFNLVGSIVEKGISSDQPLPTSSSAPRASVLAFPVARHRSHGPHWGPIGEGSDEDEEGDNDDESDAMNYDPISQFANPLERRSKKGLDLRNWRELLSSDRSDVQRKEVEKSIPSHVVKQKGNAEYMEVSYGESMTDNLPISREMNVNLQSNKGKRRLASDRDEEFRDPVDSMELDRFSEPSSITNSIEDGVALGNGKVDYASVSMDYECEVANDMKSKTLPIDGAKGRGRVTFGQENMVYERENSTSRGFDVAPKSEFVSIESEIDAENQARLQSMSPDEIAEAQAEIRDKINPKLLNLLIKRGIEKRSSTKTISASSDETGEPGKKHIENSPVIDRNLSPSVVSAAHQDTQRTSGKNATPVVSTDGGGLWDAWSKRVEAARNLRFSLDGNVIQIDSLHSTNFAVNDLRNGGYSADNVAERDLLRTEGDPAAAGYTIKEALALARSVIPGQRAMAMHIISSVLSNALQNIHQDNIVKHSDNMQHFADWEAVWAFALGPEPELVLSLRLSLDDNHDSVVLACAKAIQCILAYDWNERFFDISDKLASQEKHLYTAPVFRSKPDLQGGFLRGGFWKYSAKPSNILGGNIAEGNDEGERTIQDDNVIAGQDIVAGFVRMGILPRLQFLLKTSPTVALEECILSILIAIARHSPTSADAIFKCEGLVQIVQDRFMPKNRWEVQACKVKSVKLVRVLAQSDNRNCSEFVKNGTFERMMWKLYQGPFSLNDWVAVGKEHCNLLSQLMVEQLRFWKVCIKYGHCVSHFTYFYPALCFWLNPPTIDKLIEKDVLQQYSSVAGEAYLVLGALAEKLPKWYTRDSLSHLSPETCNDDTASWCWSDVASVVDIALQWIALDTGAPLYKLLHKQNESHFLHRGWAKSLLWVISAVLPMLSTIIKKATPAYSLNPKTAERGQLLLDLVSKIGKPLINNGFLCFTGSDFLDHSSQTNAGGSFTQKLCQFRHQTDRVTSLASTCCLHGVLRLVASIDELIDLAKNQVHAISSKEKELSKEDKILDAGILKCSVAEWKRVFCECVKPFDSANHTVHNIEVFGRGGPAPGVGIGWGVACRGFWSLAVVLAQEDARLLVDLLPVFNASSHNYPPVSEDKAITSLTINCTLAILLSVGPRDKSVAERALDALLQIPVLKHLKLCLFNFLHNGQGGQLSSREYKEDDLGHFGNILTSHFRNRWLCKKRKKPKAQDGIGSPQHELSQSRSSLATIHEDIDTSATLREDSGSLAVEWAKQRLPLPSHWLLSPIATIGDEKIGDLSRTSNGIQDPVELLEVAKAGLFFVAGIEAMSFSLSEGDCSPIKSVPLVWKLHSLSVSLFSGMGVLEEESGRDIFEALQRFYGHHLDELRLSANIKGCSKCNMNLLNFQSDIHESYSTFIETLVEQFAAISYGDLAYGRQISIYLHCDVDARTRFSAWNALSNAHVLELLPSLDNFIAKPEGYLKPLEEDESLLEVFLKSWVNGALDRAATRCSGTYTIALHNLSSFIFSHDIGEKLSLRNKFVKSLLRQYSRKQQHETMMLDLMQYNYLPNTETSCRNEDLSLKSILARRFQILTEACEGNSSLVSMVERLKTASSRLA